MNSITFTTHTIRVYSLDHKDEKLPLQSFGIGRDLFNDFRDFLDEFRKNFSHNEHRQALMKVENYSENGRIMKGIINTGEYGFASSIYNYYERRETYQRKPNEAEMLPFYFVFIAPLNATKGFIGLQRFGQKGIQTILFDSFAEYFANKHRTYRIEINNLVPEKALEYLLDQGEVKVIRLISHHIPTELDEFYKNNDQEVNGTIELKIKASRHQDLNAIQHIRDFFCGKRTIATFAESVAFEPEEIKIEFDLNGKIRTLSLTDQTSFKPLFDLTNQVKFAENGHPTFSSLDHAVMDLVNDMNLDNILGRSL
jgi:hypothetical protein